MRELASEVGRRLVAIGYPPDEREFVPHLTIARFRRPTDVRPYCDAIGAGGIGAQWRVEEIVLFESTLGAQGARHEERARIPVGG
jgi:2'-5' RNA ligase